MNTESTRALEPTCCECGETEDNCECACPFCGEARHDGEDCALDLRVCPHCNGETTAHKRHCDFCGELS